jgi:hypothetical protein
LSGPALWIVERGDASVYIFGMRPIFADVPWFVPYIADALDACSDFWCETPPTSEFAAHPLLAELGLSPDVALRDRLDPATNARLESVARGAGIDPDGLQMFRPWIAAQIVRHAAYAQLYSGPTMDDILRDAAVAAGTRMHTEFTAEGVLRAFGELPPDVEREALNYDLDMLEMGADAMREWYLRAIAGDLTIDEQDATRVASAYPAFHRLLARDRNAAWEPRVDAALSNGVPTFVAVGTLHLVGPDNVFTFLRDDVRRVA